MSGITVREAVPVNIGLMTIYCESFKAEATTSIYEQPTVTGATVRTNKCRRSAKITLTGRIYNDSNPFSIIAYIDNITAKGTIRISYRGIAYPDCMVQSYTAEDRGEDVLYVSLTLVTNSEAVTRNEGGGG